LILEGALEHKDSMGTGSVIYKDEVQVMSAGTGITHSEFNPSDKDAVKLFQIWIFPKEKNIKPRYDQKSFPISDRKNKLIPAVSGLNKKGSLYIHQDAEIYLGNFEKGKKVNYQISNAANGAYIFVIDGSLKVVDEELCNRDAIGISEVKDFEIEMIEDSNFLIIDVPMG
jgi:redox-sensitive bicupin YhaK (pirin superfamily)